MEERDGIYCLPQDPKFKVGATAVVDRMQFNVTTQDSVTNIVGKGAVSRRTRDRASIVLAVENVEVAEEAVGDDDEVSAVVVAMYVGF